jgi:hypothetical protein
MASVHALGPPAGAVRSIVITPLPLPPTAMCPMPHTIFSSLSLFLSSRAGHIYGPFFIQMIKIVTVT